MLKWIISSSALILAVAAIRFALRGKLTARVQYAVWALVMLRLLLPFSIGTSGASVATVVERSPVVQLSERINGADSLELTPTGEVEAYYDGAGQGTVVAENASEAQFNFMSALLSIQKLLTPLWIMGAVGLGLTFIGAGLRFSAEVRRSRERLINANSTLPVYVTDAVDSPCLFGLFRPVIYVTPAVAGDECLMRHALAHETSHYAQRDHIWCVLRCVCLAMHWYNPLVWLAANLSKRDCELACDERTVKRLGETERANYGRSLIKLTCENARGAVVATTMCAKPKELKERIAMLTKKKRSFLAILLAALLAMTATACSFTGGESTSSPTPASTAASIVPAEGQNGENVFSFTAPEGADSVYIRAYQLKDGAWEAFISSSTAMNGSTGGQLVCDFDPTAKTFAFGLTFEDGSSYERENLNLGDRAPDIESWGAVWMSDPVDVALDEEVPLYMFNGVRGETGANSFNFFKNPEDITELGEADDEYICFTVTFQSDGAALDPVATSSPTPAMPENQGSDIVGFRTVYSDTESYSDVVNTWVRAYASNLVMGLAEDDPASCSGVSIEEISLVAAAMTQPERVIAYMQVGCTPRDEDAFIKTFGQVGAIINAVTEEILVSLDRYVVLEHRGDYWECTSASTDRPDLWGYMAQISRDDYENYVYELSQSGISPESLISQVNYSELGEASDDSWEALLEALETASISGLTGTDRSNDQCIRDIYVMYTALASDGAYSEWLTEILASQRQSDESAFEQALSAFGEDDQQTILSLSVPLD